MMDRDSGLLQSDMKELEMIEFEINERKFGINVLKVKEIIQPLPITPIPHAHPIILGIIQLRGEVLPVISMEQALKMESTNNVEQAEEKFIVAEFNKQKVVFHVHRVSQIHRIDYDHIEKASDSIALDYSHITGVIKREEYMILLIDFEKIIEDITSESY